MLVGAALLVGALAKGGPTGPPRAEPEVPVTATNQGTAPANNSPVLAGDPTDPRFVVMANRLDAPDFDCALQVSGNGGRGWLTVRPVPQLPEGADKCSTYLGGSGDEEGQAIAVDAQGNAYVTGFTDSLDFPTTPGAFDTTCGTATECSEGDFPSGDAFVTKLNANGTGLVYSTYLGGSGQDNFRFDRSDIAVDDTGAAYVTGTTASPDFPTTPGAFQEISPDDRSAFVSQLSPDGSALVYSTYFGAGGGGTTGDGIALGTDATVFVTGSARSFDLPTTPGAFQEACTPTVGFRGIGCVDAFVARLRLEGQGPADLLYSTFVGGADSEPAVGPGDGSDIALDGEGNIYLTGTTFDADSTSDFPTTVGAFQSDLGGIADAFVVKLTPAGGGASDLAYSTYLGGPGEVETGTAISGGGDLGLGIAVHTNGSIYVTGETLSPDFPTTPGAFQTSFPGCSDISCDAFVSVIDPAGNGTDDLTYSTFLGAPGTIEVGRAIAVDDEGRAVVTGETASSAFPTINRSLLGPRPAPNLQTRCGCFTSSPAPDAFVAQLDPAGGGDSDLIFSTFLGGTGFDRGLGIAVQDGSAFVTGATNSEGRQPTSRLRNPPQPLGFPTTKGAFRRNFAGGSPRNPSDAFVSRIDGL